MRKHDALIRQAEISKARSDAFSLGIFVGILIGGAISSATVWMAFQ
jgi:hypothetical protein